jgi:hypothetical protein
MMCLTLLIVDYPWTSLVDVTRGTMSVTSREGMLFLHVVHISKGKTVGQQGDPLIA